MEREYQFQCKKKIMFQAILNVDITISKTKKTKKKNLNNLYLFFISFHSFSVSETYLLPFFFFSHISFHHLIFVNFDLFFF